MNTSKDLRAYERVAIANPVKVRNGGRMASYALAINISMGGLLLGAVPTLPVGSPCEVAISLPGGSGAATVTTRGIVVRSGAQETAIRFLNTLDPSTYAKVVASSHAGFGRSMLNAYVNYFKISQDKHYTGSEAFFGVSPSTFKKVITATFTSSIALAILPVWLFQNLIPAWPNAVKVLLAFGYGLFWLAVLQPSADLVIFKIIRNRRKRSPADSA